MFDVLLDLSYPFQQPKIFCRTPFSSPPLNDGRDLYGEIVSTEWRIARKLAEMVQYIPDFVVEVIESE